MQTVTALPAFLGLLAVHVTITLPYCVGLLRASVLLLDRSQEEAAANLGAGPLRRIVLVILQALAPGLAAAGIMAVLLSFEEVTITSFLTTARMTTLPVRIYAEASYSLEPTVFAVSTLMIGLTVVAMLAVGRLVRLDIPRLLARDIGAPMAVDVIKLELNSPHDVEGLKQVLASGRPRPTRWSPSSARPRAMAGSTTSAASSRTRPGGGP